MSAGSRGRWVRLRRCVSIPQRTDQLLDFVALVFRVLLASSLNRCARGSRGMVCRRRLLLHKKKHERSCFVRLKDKLHFLPFSGTRRFGTQLVGPTGDRVKAKVAQSRSWP